MHTRKHDRDPVKLAPFIEDPRSDAGKAARALEPPGGTKQALAEALAAPVKRVRK